LADFTPADAVGHLEVAEPDVVAVVQTHLTDGLDKNEVASTSGTMSRDAARSTFPSPTIAPPWIHWYPGPCSTMPENDRCGPTVPTNQRWLMMVDQSRTPHEWSR
jgi:hypothetical protein